MSQQLIVRLNQAIESLNGKSLNLEGYKSQLFLILRELKGGPRLWLLKTIQNVDKLKTDPPAFKENQLHNLSVVKKLVTGKATIPEVARGVPVKTPKSISSS